MKIIYHHRTQRVGVEGVHISGVIDGLEKQGHEVVEVALVHKEIDNTPKNKKDQANSDQNMKKALKKVASHFPNFLFRIFECFYNFICFYKILAVYLKNRDIDFIYDRYAYFSFVPVLLGKILKIPVVLEVNIVTGLKDTRDVELFYLCKIIELWVLKNCDKILVVSNILKQVLIKKGIVENKIIVQPNGCDMDISPVDISHIINAEAQEFLKQKTIICFLGRLLPWYRLEKLIYIFDSVQKDNLDAVLMIIGDGIEKENLFALTHQVKQESNVIFTGEVSHPEAISLVNICDLCVIPETNEWTSPVKLFEYMGMGKPVIAPDIESVSSIMVDGKHGKLFKIGDFEEFQQHLLTLIQKPELRSIMGKNAREHIMNHYTWNNVANNIIQIASTIVK